MSFLCGIFSIRFLLFFHRLFDRLKELIIRLERCDPWMVLLDLLRARRNRNPSLLASIIPRSFVAVPAGDRLKADGLKCLHRRILGLLDPHLKSRDLPSGATSRELQKIVGQPSFFIRGFANCVNVSLIMMT